MKTPDFKIAWLLFLSAIVSGCASQSTVDRLEGLIGSPTEAINIVGTAGSREQPEFITGGFLAGSRAYAVANWNEIASTRFASGKLALLAAENEKIRLGKVFASTESNDQERWDTLLSSRFAVMADLLGGQMTRVDIKFRLVPSGVRYRFAAKQPFNGFDAISLELLAVIPPSKELNRDWLLTEAITAMHESFHVIRKDSRRFPREISRPEEEIQAYLVSMCSSVIASHHLPDALLAFPKSLEEAVDKDERDIAIADVFQQMLEQEDQPTVVGVNVAMLAFFRYLTQLKSSGVIAPAANDSMPLCKATARDELHWAEHDIDLQIRHLAEQAAKLAPASRTWRPADTSL